MESSDTIAASWTRDGRGARSQHLRGQGRGMIRSDAAAADTFSVRRAGGRNQPVPAHGQGENWCWDDLLGRRPHSAGALATRSSKLNRRQQYEILEPYVPPGSTWLGRVVECGWLKPLSTFSLQP